MHTAAVYGCAGSEAQSFDIGLETDMKKLGGIIIPAVTPFGEDGELDTAALAYNYEKWNESAVEGYMCLGSNGEFRMLSDDEALEVIRVASRTADPDKVFIAGVARESLYQTLKFIEKVDRENLKIDYLSLLTPHYFKKLMTDEALIRYFTEIADRSPLPVLLYCAPAFSNDVTISAEVVKTLADHPNIHGIKDTSTTMMEAYMAAVGNRDDFEVLSGTMNTILKCMDLGGRGGVVSASNYFPDQCAEVVRLYREDGRDAAYAYYGELRELIKATGGRGSVAGVKCTMNLLGLKGGFTRLPILPLDGAIREEIGGALKNAGLI